MHAISSYRGNRRTHTHTNRQDRLQYTAPQQARSVTIKVKLKGKASTLDIAPLTILNSGTLQPWKWQLTGNDCSTVAHAVAVQSPR